MRRRAKPNEGRSLFLTIFVYSVRSGYEVGERYLVGVECWRLGRCRAYLEAMLILLKRISLL